MFLGNRHSPKKPELFLFRLGKNTNLMALRFRWFPPSCSGKSTDFVAKQASLLSLALPLSNNSE